MSEVLAALFRSGDRADRGGLGLLARCIGSFAIECFRSPFDADCPKYGELFADRSCDLMCLSVEAPATREVVSGAVGKGFIGDLGGVPSCGV